MDRTELGNNCKFFEKLETDKKLMPMLPILARLDGKSFSKLTKNMKRPYDLDFMYLMHETTKYIIEQTNALIGYTQSDEMTFIWFFDNIKSQMLFNGKLHKLNSTLASMASVKFYSLFLNHPKFNNQLPTFDSRVWIVPNKEEAVKVLQWRENDARKNSISMLAQAHFSHKQLQNKNRTKMQDMLMKLDQPVNWNNQIDSFKRGTYFRRILEERTLSFKEIDKLPLKHEARKNPNLKFIRSSVQKLNIKPFNKIINKIEFIFDKEDPIYV